MQSWSRENEGHGRAKICTVGIWKLWAQGEPLRPRRCNPGKWKRKPPGFAVSGTVEKTVEPVCGESCFRKRIWPWYAVHRGVELLGITGYIPAIHFSNDPSKFHMIRNRIHLFAQRDSLLYITVWTALSPQGRCLCCYQVQGDVCRECTSRKTCFDMAGVRRRILTSSCCPAFYRGHFRVNTPEYLCMMGKRKIWAENMISQPIFYLCH